MSFLFVGSCSCPRHGFHQRGILLVLQHQLCKQWNTLFLNGSTVFVYLVQWGRLFMCRRNGRDMGQLPTSAGCRICGLQPLLSRTK